MGRVDDHVSGGHRRVPVGGAEVGSGVVGHGSGRNVDRPVPQQGRRRVRPVSASVHPYRTADGTGHANGPLEPGQSGCCSPAGQGRQGQRTTGADLGPLDLQEGESGPQRHDQAFVARICHQEIGAVSEDQDGYIDSHQRRGHGHQGGLVRDFDGHCRRPAHPVGGPTAQRCITFGCRAEAPVQHVEIVGAAHVGPRSRPSTGTASPRVAGPPAPISSSGSEVRSPAPRVKQRSPGPSSPETAAARSTRPGT